MRKNYQAWSVNEKDFPKSGTLKEKIKFLVKYAVLAPSSHNSQPWRFKINDIGLELFGEEKRKLKIADPDDCLLYFALGCALENLAVAAAHFGLDVRNEYPKENEEKIRVFFEEKENQGSADAEDLFFFVSKRRVNRSAYEDKIPEDFLRSTRESCGQDDFFTVAIKDKEEKRRLVDLIMESRLDFFDNKKFRREMSEYKRNNFSFSYTGMPGFTMGFSSAASLFAPFMIRHVNVMKFIYKKEIKHLNDETPVFVVLCGGKDDKEAWIKSGRLFERIFLRAQKQGLSADVEMSPILKEEYWKKLQEIAGTGQRPRICFRLGFAKQPSEHSPRLPAGQVIEELEPI